MTDQQILNTILKNTYTKSSFLKRLSILRIYLEHYFFIEKISLEKFFSKTKISNYDKKALIDWAKDFYSSFTLSNFYQKIQALSEDIKNINNITLYIPIDTSIDDKETLGSWFRKNISQTALLDLHYNPKLVGGAALVENNIYRDYSLHHFIKNKKEEIMGILNNYQK